MIEEDAKVVLIDGDQTWVEVKRQSVCGVCSANKACGTAVLQKVLGNKRTVVRVLSDIPLSIGDHVVVGLEEKAFLKGSFAVYLIPLILMLGFGLLGETLSSQLGLIDEIGRDTTAILFALFGLVLGAAWLKIFNATVQTDPRYQPIVLRQSVSSDVMKVSLASN